MKKNIIYISVLAFALLLSACERVEEIDAPVSGKMEEMKFFASIESGADTKTMIDGNVGDETRHLKWLPGDAIGVYNNSSRKFEKFVNVNAETSASGVFEGANTVQDVYYAVYPYSESHSYADRDKIMTVDLPVVQNYAENTFGNGANPMVAHAESGEELMFQNLCGVLVINLTGSVTVKSMSVTLLDETGNLAPVSGKHTVSMDYIESPTLKSTEESLTSVTLDCGEGVALNSAEPTPFHIVLPAGTYAAVKLMVLTTDGRMMVKQGTKSLRIRRTRVSSAGVLEYQEAESVDLSERGTSNCYIVSEPGVYVFNCLVKGNSTESVGIPVSAAVVWETKNTDAPVSTGDIIDNVGLYEGYLSFVIPMPFTPGNALVAVKDATGNILWSWHIWVADFNPDLTVQTYYSGAKMMDRNLGALSIVENDALAYGLLYQWGRKDPYVNAYNTSLDGFAATCPENAITFDNKTTDNDNIGYSIANPSVVINDITWNRDAQLWDKEKTMYDPCPVGWKVPEGGPGVWLDFNTSDRYNYKGVWFDEPLSVPSAYYPNAGFTDGDDSLKDGNSAHHWSSTSNGTKAYNFCSYWGGIPDSQAPTDCLYSVRCAKDEGYPQVEISGFEEVTTTSAKVVVKVKSAGVSEVTERGIIWGTTEDLSGGTKIVSAVASDEYAIELTGLQKSTKYYVQPYAVNSRGESTGLVKSFRTKYSDTEVDLSSEGTANCYVVRYPGTHSFDCTVKGNSEESVGEPASVEVLWETDNTSTPISSGDIVSDVQIGEGGRVIFEASGKPGNALIAVKDVDGVILWSWHIWSSDYDPNETAQTYSGRAVMMDRNLGALNVEKGDVLSWGLFYQQGRKDPFIGCGDIEAKTFAATVPSDVISYSSNGGNEFIVQNPYYLTQNFTFAWSDEKSMMDPCPPGWKVPESSVFDGFTNGDTSVPYSMVFTAPLSSPDAYFPLTGDTENGNQRLRNPGTTSYMWTTEQGYAYCIHAGAKHSRSMYDENPVRCMKE